MDISGAPDSYLHNDVSYSYGNYFFCSPRTNGSGSVWLINTSGDVWLFGTSGSLYVDGSYGSPMTAVNIVTYGAWDVWTSGAVDFYNGYAFNSYGLYSPDTSDIQFVWMIFPSGFINHNLDYTISYSYGIALRARKIPMALGMSTLLVVSTVTTTMSTVPTDETRRARVAVVYFVLILLVALMDMAVATTIPTENYALRIQVVLLVHL